MECFQNVVYFTYSCGNVVVSVYHNVEGYEVSMWTLVSTDCELVSSHIGNYDDRLKGATSGLSLCFSSNDVTICTSSFVIFIILFDMICFEFNPCPVSRVIIISLVNHIIIHSLFAMKLHHIMKVDYSVYL